MAEIIAIHEVLAGVTDSFNYDVTGLTPDEVAAMIEREAAPNVSLCHECAHSINDPQVGDMIAFTVDDVEYERAGSAWREV